MPWDSDITDAMAADLAAIETDSMTWNGSDYSGVFTELVKSDSPEVGGFERSYDASFYVRTSLFTGSRPNVNEAVTVGTKTFRIGRVHEIPDDVSIEIELISESGR